MERLTQALLGEPKDREQLVEQLREAQQRDLLDSDALGMIEGVLQVSEMQVRDIMIPRSQMVVVERDARPEDILPILIESQHSRFPVIGENRDEVVGILLAKDLLAYFAQGSPGGGNGSFNIRDVLRPAAFIPESKRLNVLLKEFRASRNHIAIVVDEYGGVAGLVTIEDVLEQIVGEIEDEHDVEEDAYIMDHGGNHYTVKALTPIEDFNEYFGADFSDKEFDTIGGLLLNGFGHLPKRGETIDLGRFHFRVLRADNRRIYLLAASVRTPEEVLAQATADAGVGGGDTGSGSPASG
ncbi:MAG TPA: transporter associated domain-containing protein [Gammaproteobacteria bacterium]|nr:transporter associated domain-containing protein [Gammaproteobacteria bacterium]